MAGDGGAVRVGQQTGGGGFNSFAAGKKHYGAGRSAPNVGKTANTVGYGKRDAAAANRLDALQRRLQGGNF